MAAGSPEQVPSVLEVSGLGPGRFVMVAGPSGAGKDSLIQVARDAFAGNAHYVFPRRFVTRPSSGDEDNAELTSAAFEQLRRANGFAACWTAHGLCYGLPKDIDQDVARGRTVICNVSRSVVDDLRARYANAVLIEITASAEVLEQRLLARGRATDGPIAQRLSRSGPCREQLKPDALVDNSGTFESAAAAFLAVLR